MICERRKNLYTLIFISVAEAQIKYNFRMFSLSVIRTFLNISRLFFRYLVYVSLSIRNHKNKIEINKFDIPFLQHKYALISQIKKKQKIKRNQNHNHITII